MIEPNASCELYENTVVNPAKDELRGSTVGDTMDCLKCIDLRQAFESKLGKYIEARSAAYYRVSTELAAHKNVDMERAWSELEEHQLVCGSAAKVRCLDHSDDERLHSTFINAEKGHRHRGTRVALPVAECKMSE